VLNGRLELQGVDVEALAARALGDQLGTMGATLRHDDHEDALSYVIAAVWQASLKYDPERSISFSTFAYQLSRRRTIDWFRGRYGRTRWTFGDGYQYDRERPNIYPSMPSTVNWKGLSEQGKDTLRTIAVPISLGYSPAEVADSLGVSSRMVHNALEELRGEIRAQAV
jgi:DNA-directed RNA polymerase specialized sigma24 family protein